MESEKPPKFTGRQKLLLGLMSAMAFATFITFAVIAPFFPQVAEGKGMSVTEIGLVFGMYFFGVMLSSMIFGNFVDKIGAKFMFISGMVTRAVADILFGVLVYAPSGRVFVAMCFTCRAFESVGAAAFMTSMYSIVARQFPDNIAQVFGFLQIFNGMGLMLGPPVGGILFDIGGFTFPFLILGGSMLIVTAISFFTMPELTDSGTDNNPQNSVWMFSLLKNPHIVLNMFCAVLVFGPIAFVEISLQDHLLPFGLTPGLVGLVFTCETGAYGFFSPVWGWISDHWFRPKLQLAFGAALYGISYMWLGPSPILGDIPRQLWLIILSLVGIGISSSAINSVVFKDTMMRVIDDGLPANFHTFGLVSGLYILSVTFGAFLGPTIGSIISEETGFPTAAWYYSLVMLSGSGVIVTFKLFSLRFCKTPSPTEEEKVPLMNGKENGQVHHTSLKSRSYSQTKTVF